MISTILIIIKNSSTYFITFLHLYLFIIFYNNKINIKNILTRKIVDFNHLIPISEKNISGNVFCIDDNIG